MCRVCTHQHNETLIICCYAVRWDAKSIFITEYRSMSHEGMFSVCSAAKEKAWSVSSVLNMAYSVICALHISYTEKTHNNSHLHEASCSASVAFRDATDKYSSFHSIFAFFNPFCTSSQFCKVKLCLLCNQEIRCKIHQITSNTSKK